jgi:glutamate formiminotransferase / 5-formyltetrahydrofolate cyclo-ligase
LQTRGRPFEPSIFRVAVQIHGLLVQSTLDASLKLISTHATVRNLMSLIACVPNVSEGRRRDVVEAMAGAIRTVAGVTLADHSADAAHNRSVFTLAGEAEAVAAAVLLLYERAVAEIDLGAHRGQHPRIGAVDVVPFVPLQRTPMSACVMLARRTGRAIADRFQVPVYLYEEAAATPARKNLEDIRRGGFEGLATKMKIAEWRPDFGPSAPHPTAGASAVGARQPLIAFNVNLATNRLDVAKAVAAAVRQRGGGLPFVKALAMDLPDRAIVQVSMNLTNYRETSMRRAFDAVAREAGRHGVQVLESEIIGLVPAAALAPGDEAHLVLNKPAADCILENRIGTL